MVNGGVGGFHTNPILLVLGALVAAGWLKFSTHLGASQKQRRKARERRRTVALMAARLIYDLILLQKKKGGERAVEVLRVRSEALRCISAIASDLIGYENPEAVTASLLEYGPDDTDNMTVVARSSLTRALDLTYKASTLVGYHAVAEARYLLVNDIGEDARWKDLGTRPYSSVLAIPICRNGDAVGVLSLDCATAYDFAGVAGEIVVFVEPYVAGLSATFDKDCLRVACKYQASNQKLA